MGLPSVLVVLALLLAGCSGGGAKDDPLSAATQAAQDLDIQATAETGIIRGIVVDGTITPIAGVAVRIASAGRNTTTTTQGAFGFDGLEPGLYFLSAQHQGYESVQQSVDVVANEQDPPLVRVLMNAVPSVEPYIEATQRTLFMDTSIAVLGSSITLGGFTGQGSFLLRGDISPNSTMAQVEYIWDPTLPTGDSINTYGGTYAGGEDNADRIHYTSLSGSSPLVVRLNSTDGNRSADRLTLQIRADPSVLSIFANQPVEAYVHIFYNMVARDGWQFSRDGEHPLPP